ncbi:MAG: hypothetical protein AMK72_13640 [Planctomycetes bacterium SM23_25]|nr:MAG: hypothetical protein AMS14_07710 [Planctomycetes bacterium DG_20]KPK43198.1 MAG: hypothetical protein AMK72_13640 [Planctomycetes bacterium SM23_25]
MPAGPKRFVAATVVLVTLVGCGPNPGGPRAQGLGGADTSGPRALLADWHASLVAGEKGAYLACFVGSQDELVLALALMEVVQASYAFHDAVVAAYGEQGWQLFQASKGARVDLFPRDPNWTATITLARLGDAAFGYLRTGRVPLHLSREGEGWRLHASGLVPPGFEAKRAADYLFRWAATLRELAPKIGEKRVEAERARVQVTEDFHRRIAPAEQPEAAAALDFFMMH